ncbi:MAG: hypothetical protein QMC67_05400 [Candidatus Wallbacteria bacterium]
MWEEILKTAIKDRSVTKISIMAGEKIDFAATPKELKILKNCLCYSRDANITNAKELHTFVSFRKIAAVEIEKKR